MDFFGSMRNTFVNYLTELAAKDSRIFLIVGDLGFTVIEPFRDTFPDRFLNVGVAEQNMTAVAAGIAREGYHVFTYSIANFTTLRCMEQIRNDVCYHKLPVCVVSVGGGYMYGNLGPTHHATEDVGMMRVLPGMRVFVPFSQSSTRKAVDEILAEKKPAYLRIGREDMTFDEIAGNGFTLIQKREGAREAVISIGQLGQDIEAMATEKNADWYALCRLKPLDVESVRRLAGEYEKITVVEDHQFHGGACSILSEAISPFDSVSIRDQFSPHIAKEAEQRRNMMTKTAGTPAYAWPTAAKQSRPTPPDNL